MTPRGDRRFAQRPGAAGGLTPGPDLGAADLNQMREFARTCTECRLCEARRNVVFGDGPTDARLMFVGETPGYQEDGEGTMFVGEVGQLFDELLGSIGMSRDDVYATPVVKCRPPHHRQPFSDELQQCERYLFHQVALIRPHVICTFGTTSLRVLSGRMHTIGEVRGRPLLATIQGRTTVILPLYNPAAAIYAPGLLSVLRDDVRRIPRLLRGRIDEPEPDQSQHSAFGPGAEQLALDVGRSNSAQ